MAAVLLAPTIVNLGPYHPVDLALLQDIVGNLNDKITLEGFAKELLLYVYPGHKVSHSALVTTCDTLQRVLGS